MSSVRRPLPFTAALLAAAATTALNDLGNAQELRELVVPLAQELELTAEGPSGPGYEWLVDEGARAPFFVLGESHGNRETPALTRALLASLAPKGHGAYAIESGPESTRLLVERTREDGLEAIAALMHEMPMSVAFLNWREEAEALVGALELGYAVWGIDQEFIACGRFLTGRLVELAHDDESRALATRWHQKALEGFRVATSTGDQSQGFMNVVTDAAFDELDAAYTEGSEEARAILAALRSSAGVYGHYAAQRYFMNNRDRIRLMKGYLAERWNEDPEQRVFVKLGAAHAGRGYSPYDQLDVGNLAAELSVARGSESFHLYVLALRSVAADGSSRDFMAGSPHMQPFCQQLDDKARLFDLRELRAWASRNREKEPELHSMIFRFDALLILPQFHASESFVQVSLGQ